MAGFYQRCPNLKKEISGYHSQKDLFSFSQKKINVVNHNGNDNENDNNDNDNDNGLDSWKMAKENQ